MIDVVAAHPEYHALLENLRTDLNRACFTEDGAANPFLHMGLHVALREQLGADRPKSLRPVYQRLVTRLGNAHEAEHQVIECIAESLTEAQRSGAPLSDHQYIDCLHRLL